MARSQYEQIWDAHSGNAWEDIHERTGYSKQEIIQGHLEIFMAFPGMEDETTATKHELWARYTSVLVRGGSEAERHQFWSDMGIDPRDFDWTGWREMMGYSRG